MQPDENDFVVAQRWLKSCKKNIRILPCSRSGPPWSVPSEFLRILFFPNKVHRKVVRSGAGTVNEQLEESGFR